MVEKAGKSALTIVWNLVMWIVALLVALAVGFGMINRTLTVLWIPEIITVIAGWIVVILVLIGALLAIIDKLRKA